MVLGGKGYLGVNLCKTLDNPKVYDIKDGNDVLDYWKLEQYIKDCDEVYHLAAVPGVQECEKHPKKTHRVNVEGTFNVSQLCSIHRKPFIFTSSFAVYGEPLTVYGSQKKAAEAVARVHGGTVCRLSNVYGGDMFTELKNTAVSNLMKGTFIERGHGEQLRDFIHVDKVCVKLKENIGHQGIFDICSGKLLTINRLKELSLDPLFPNNIGGD